MALVKYTDEQHDVLDHIVTEDGILLVRAGAGAGKSFLSKQIALKLKPRRGLYTAFNKAIVLEGVNRFKGTNVECKTFHSLAYRFVAPKESPQDLSYTCIEEDISYPKKYEIITAINMFYVSASTDMYDFLFDYFKEYEEDGEQLSGLCVKYIEKMIEGTVPPTFNFLLKYFHLMLVEGTAKCEYDLVILDEINDVTAVNLEIFKLINAPKKLGLGEPSQAIYAFLNLVDGFELLKDETCLSLTKSFRCSEEIAASIQAFMRRDVDFNFTFVGSDEPVRNGQHLHVTMTNAKIVQKISELLESRKGFHLLRNIAEIFALPLAIVSASAGKEVYQKKYKHLEKEYKQYVKHRKVGQSYLMYIQEELGDQETRSAVSLLLKLNRDGINIFDLYKRAKAAKQDKSYTVATVFTSKGLEFESVYIDDDLNNAITVIREKGGIQDDDDLVAYRCYYVAASRCGVNLMNAQALKRYSTDEDDERDDGSPF